VLTLLASPLAWLGVARDASAASTAHLNSLRARQSALVWHTNYIDAYQAAKSKKRMLLIVFEDDRSRDTVRELKRWIANDASLESELAEYVLASLPTDAQVTTAGRTIRLLDHAAFEYLHGGAGLAMLDLRNPAVSYYGRVVTALPFADGKYYRWQNSHLNVTLGLPPGSLSQRTMVWAVRIHPESPASTSGELEPTLARAAADHSEYQARIGVQGHQEFSARYARIRSETGAGAASEVVAESWPNEKLIDACLDCVLSWRQSPGHWGAVRRRHRLFGYDIRRGRNGIWYGTGIFAN
jgi:hypothetical protein